MKNLTTLIINSLLFSTISLATIINVPEDQPTIQAGLNAANESDTVMVAEGTYTENIIWPATNGIKLIGSGEEDCFIDGNQQASVIWLESSGIDTASLISGFTIQNGSAYRGGGIFCDNSSPSLVNVTVTNNSASGYGGGIYCEDNSSLSLSNVTITNNSTSNDGGGICCENSSPGLVNVRISGNSASDYGGGIYCDYSSPSLENMTISGNSAFYYGGGIYCYSSSPSLVNCILWNDSPQEIYFYEYYDPNLIRVSLKKI